MPRSLSNPTVSAIPAKSSTKPKDRDPVASGARDATFNRSAGHNYFLTDRFECGIALRGTEVKSIREGNANLKDAYGLLKDGEVFLLNAHIGPFSHGNAMNHESLRTRKLLLHKREIDKLQGLTKQKGYTLIPVKLYFRNGRVKCELALAKGKQDWDKRATERNREADKEAKAAIARSQRR
jgi:SsrA-binding protein